MFLAADSRTESSATAAAPGLRNQVRGGNRSHPSPQGEVRM